MRFVVHRTFLTLVNDDDNSPEPHSPRSRSAPATLHHTDRLAAGAAQGGSRAKPRKKKQAKGGRDRSTEDSQVFEEYAAIVAQEVALLPLKTPEQPPASTMPQRGRDRRGDVSHGATVSGRASAAEPQIRIHLGFHDAAEPRPANAIFVRRDGHGEIGFDHDPHFSTSTLRCLLLGINNKEWDDGFVVTTSDGRFIPIGSTLGEQGVMPGARLRLQRPSELDLCAQS